MSPSQKKAAFKSFKNRPQLNSSSRSNRIFFSYELETAVTCLQVIKKWPPKVPKNSPQLNSSSSSDWILVSYELETAFTCLQVKKKWPPKVPKIVHN